MLSITGPDGTNIKVHDRPGGKRRLTVTAAKGGGAEIVLDAESARDVGLALGAHPLDLDHDDKTLEKARAAIQAAKPYMTETAITDVLNGLLNAGLLIRERS